MNSFMKLEESIIVHNIGISRTTLPNGIHVNIAACRLCGEVFEEKSGPLEIKTHGLFAVDVVSGQSKKIWVVVEPLSSEMKVCTPERPL
jgi:hypothetical protein